MRASWGKYVCAFFLLLSRIEAGSWGPGAPATQGSLERKSNRLRNDSGKSMTRMCLAHGVIPRMADYDDEHEEAVASHGQSCHMRHHSSHSLGVHRPEFVHGSSHGHPGRHFSNVESRHALSHGKSGHAVLHGEPRHIASNRDLGHHSSNVEPEHDESNGEIGVLGVTHSGHVHQHSHQTPKDSGSPQGSPGHSLRFGKGSVNIAKREAPICWLCAGRHRAFKRSAPSYFKEEGYPAIDDYQLLEYAPQGDHINNNEKKTIGNHPYHHHHHHHHHQIGQPLEYAPIASPDQSLVPGANECGEENSGECAAQLEGDGENSLRKKSVKIYQYSEDSLTSPLVEQKRSVDSNYTTAKPIDHAGVCTGGNCDNVKRSFDNCNCNLESPNSDEGVWKRPLLGEGRIARRHCDVKLGNCHKINKREAHIGRKETKKHNHPQHPPHHHHCHYEM